MRHRTIRRFVTPFVLAGVASALLNAQSGRQDAADAERLIKALEIQPGTILGEIGAGSGRLTLAMAKAVGREGRVFSNEVNKNHLAGIARAAEAADLKNVTTVEGQETDTNFADQCCDAIFMRDVYHHLRNPGAMNASVFRSLKPGGRFAIQDFGPPPGAESASPEGRSADGHHGVTTATLERELKAAGFEILSSTELQSRQFLIVARRPAADGTEVRHGFSAEASLWSHVVVQQRVALFTAPSVP